MDELDQQVRILQRLRELAADSAAAAAKDKVSATASGKDGFSIKSADGKFAVRLKGLVQTDGRFFLGDDAVPVTNTFFLRRARPILEATVGKYLEFRLQPDFGQGTTVLFDAYTDVKVSPALRRPGRQVQAAGRISSGCSRASDIVFAERALATNLAPNRDVGLQLSGDISQRRLRLAGRDLQRRARSRQRRRRRERRQGLRRPRLPPAVQDRLARGPGRRRRRHAPGIERGHDGRAGARQLSHAGPADLLPLRRAARPRRRTTCSPTAAARVSRRRPTSTPARSGSTASTSSRGRR